MYSINKLSSIINYRLYTYIKVLNSRSESRNCIETYFTNCKYISNSICLRNLYMIMSIYNMIYKIIIYTLANTYIPIIYNIHNQF